MDEKKVPEEKAPEAEINKDSKKEEEYQAVIPVMYIMLNRQDRSVGILTNPKLNVLEDELDAYGILKLAEKALDEYYGKGKEFRNNFLKSERIVRNKQAFRSFINKFKR